MAAFPHITLEQWRALIAVVDAGGYAQAAEALHKSQSSVTYAVQKLESLLKVKAFEIHGRKAILTPVGQMLYRRAKALLDEAVGLERASRTLSAGWEAEIRIAVEALFPTWVLLKVLERFGNEAPQTRIQVYETVIGGGPETLLRGEVDLAILPQIPTGFLGNPLMRMRGTTVASPSHPLHGLKRELTYRDLRRHRHLIVRDTSMRRTSKTAIEVEQRWTFTNMSTSIQAAGMGYGFAWYADDTIRQELAAGTLKPLPMREGGERFLDLYLILADPESAGPGTLRLAELIREGVATECTKAKERSAAAT
jgi:DNA-binding transcriptional LysR family regulator